MDAARAPESKIHRASPGSPWIRAHQARARCLFVWLADLVKISAGGAVDSEIAFALGVKPQAFSPVIEHVLAYLKRKKLCRTAWENNRRHGGERPSEGGSGESSGTGSLTPM